MATFVARLNGKAFSFASVSSEHRFKLENLTFADFVFSADLRSAWSVGKALEQEGHATNTPISSHGVIEYDVGAHKEAFAGNEEIYSRAYSSSPDPQPSSSLLALLYGSDAIKGSTATISKLTIDGASVTSAIQFSGDHDWFRVNLEAGKSYTFALWSAGSLVSLSDPFIELRDSFGKLIAIDDDGGIGTNSFMQFTATKSGTYYIDAQAYWNEIGAYTVKAVSSPAQDPLDTLDLGFTFYTNNINIYFAGSGEIYPVTSGYTSVVNADWTAPEQAAVLAALATISAVANLSFTIVDSADDADFTYIHSDLDTDGSGVLAQTWALSTEALLEFDVNALGWTAQGIAAGGLGFSTIIHETLHALGLDHPFYDGGDTQVMQGTLYNLFGEYGAFLLNQQVFTIMSYDDGWPVGPNGVPSSYNYGQAATPMGLDIAYLQQLYGANTSTNSGDNTYTLSGFSTQTSYASIWDTGGTDAIVFSGSQNATIDLRTATLQSQIGGGGYVSYVAGAYGGFTIANGVVIENASGGSGNDSITGNNANNVLNGGAGANTLTGLAGDDTYYVGAADVVVEALNGGADIVYSSATYRLSANVENLTLTGGAVINGTGNTLNNTLIGNSAANVLKGLTGNDTYFISAGDTVTESSGAGTDTVVIDADTFGAASYALGASIENLTLTGSAAFNGVGNSLANILIGNDGANVLSGKGGNDTYVIGLGDTVFEAANAGRDIVISSVTHVLGDNIENLTLIAGTSLDGDDINGAGNSLSNTLTGNAGLNVLTGLGGNDTYYVGAGDTVVEAASAGTDTVYASDNFVLSDNVENLILTGAAPSGGGNALNNVITGNALNNDLSGGGGNDTLNGGDGNDMLDGGIGADAMTGGKGDDYYFVDNAGDKVIEASTAGSGVDTVETSMDFSLSTRGVNVENLVLVGAAISGTGNSLANVITGNDQDNKLSGGSGADTLNGGDGNDILTGGTGADTLTGGLGADDFVFNVAASNTVFDTITDFDVAEDHIRLDNAIFTAIGANGPLAASQFYTVGVGVQGSAHVLYDATLGALYYDSNGSTAGGMTKIVTLDVGLALTNDHFFVV